MDIIKENKMVLIEFSSRSCEPCTAIQNKINDWIKDHSDILFQSISIEDDPQLASDFGIYSAPAILFFVESGKTIEKAGYFSLADVLDQIERLENIYRTKR